MIQIIAHLQLLLQDLQSILRTFVILEVQVYAVLIELVADRHIQNIHIFYEIEDRNPMLRRVFMVSDFPLEFLGSVVHLFAELFIDLMCIFDELLQFLYIIVEFGVVLIDAETKVSLAC